MLNPAVTPAFRKRFFAWLLASCALSISAFAQPTPEISGQTAACQFNAYVYSTNFTAGHSWAWTVSPGGAILQNFGNSIEVGWYGPQNSTQSVSVIETEPGGMTGSDLHTVYIVKQVLTCENSVQVSIDQDGESEILPDMLLEGTYNTYEGFKVEIFTQSGFSIGNTLTCAHVGQTFIGKVKENCSGNSCWSTITVEDKLPPYFQCPTVPTEIPCDTDIDSFPGPLVFDNCDLDIEVHLVGYQVNNTNICNGVTITRNWSAKDNYGNQAYCSEKLHISPNGPVDFPKDTTWTCTQYSQYPNITNPTALTDSLHTTGSGRPYGVGGPYCQYNYSHVDDTLAVCGNSFKIIRTWTVINWCTGEVIIEDFEGDKNQQIIKVMDFNKPTITVPPIVVNANIQGAYPTPCLSTGLLPAPTVFDSCNTVTVRIFTAVGEAIYVNGVDGKQGGYIPAPGLKFGSHIITYKVTDACGNFTEVNVVAKVVDQIAPTAICVAFTDVTLNANGFTEVAASAFNLASYDNCCLNHFLVKRVSEPNSSFASSIDLSCDDVPEVMVVLRAVDCHGNYNDCMVVAKVKDKMNPICVAPQQKIIPCTDLPPDVTQDWLNGFGTATFYDNCGGTISELPYSENVNACGEGHIIRYWKVVDNSGNLSGSCEQHIYVVPKSDWVIKFPEDFYGSCDDMVDAQELEIVNYGCDLFAVNYTDQYFALTLGDSACYKIVRTWKVINWCSYDPYVPAQVINHTPLGVWVDEEDYNNYGTYQYQQIIKIYDDTPPVLSYPFDNVFCSVDATCTDGHVFLPIQIDGVCSNAFDVVYHLDLFNNQTYDLNGTDFFEGDLPIGKHRIVYVVEDGCNNEAQIQVNFEVKDCKKPTAICENGLIVELMQTGMVPVCAKALDYGSYDNCPGTLHFSFSQDINDSCRVLTCLNYGIIPVNIWVTDAAGNQDFCSTFINVQDNMFSCSTGAPVSGLIATAETEPLQGVDVMLNNNAGNQSYTTTASGVYQFAGLTIGSDYTVTPHKDNDPLNGVTTFDLVLMSKHILGITPFTSPYQLIAADANKSGSITTFDLVEVRKLILMIYQDFPNNTSWRFVKKSYQFPNPSNPWVEVFPEVININNLPASMSGLDFVAIKIGDVNSSAVTNSLSGGETGERSAGTLSFVMDNAAFQNGATVPVTFKAKDFNTVYGFQFTLDFNQQLLDFESVVQTSITGLANFGTTMTNQGAVTVSWETNPPLTLADGEPIITLNFKAKADGMLSDAIGISSRFTTAEAYVGDPITELWQVALIVNNGNPSATTNGLRPAFELLQNVPNPFSKKTVIGFRLPTASDATLTIFDSMGRKLKVITDNFAGGYNEIELDRSTFHSDGLVYYRLEAGSFTASRSMTILD